MSAAPRLELARYLPFLLVATANELSRSASRQYAARFGIGVTEWRVLANVRLTPGITANDIAASSSLDKAAVSRAVSALVDSDRIVIGDAQGDRRKRPLHLTAIGDTLHDQVIALALDRQNRLLAGLSETQTAALLDTLAIVRANAAAIKDS